MREKKRPLAACLSTGSPVASELHYAYCGDTEKYVRNTPGPIRAPGGTMTGVHWVSEGVIESKPAVEALRCSEAKFRALFKNVGVAIFIIDAETGTVVDCNLHAEKLIGRPWEEITRMNVTELHPPEDADKHSRSVQEDARRGCIVNLETEILHKDGRRIPVIVNATPAEINGRTIMIGLFFDNTDRKRSEESLRQSEMKFRALAETAPIAICILQDGHFRYINPAMEAISGYKKEELQSIDFLDLVYPDTAEYFKSRYGEWLAGASDEARAEFKGITKSGAPRWVDISRKSIIYNGRPALLLTGTDVTDRKMAEDALEWSEEKYRKVVEQSSDCLLLADEHGIIIEFNRAGERMTGLESSEWIGRPLWELIFGLIPPVIRTPEMLGQLKADLTDAGMNGKKRWHDRTIDVEIQRPDGETRFVQIVTFSVNTTRGIMTGSIARDITESKRAEAALRDSEEKFRVLAETTNASIIMYRGERFIYINPVIETISGYSREELLRMGFMDLIHPDHQEMVRYRVLARQRGEPVPSRYEAKIIAKNGEVKWVELSAGMISYLGLPTGIATLFDITERKLAGVRLARAKAMAELYVDLMSHDINNMNQVTMGFIEIACHKVATEGKLTADNVYLLEKALKSVQNSSSLIKNVQKLQRMKMGMYEPSVLDLGAMLKEVIAQHGNVPGRDVRINCDADNGCLVKANWMLKDVFINLIGNAIKHSAGPLNVDIRLGRTYVEGRACWQVIVEDDGPGIPDCQKKILFDRLNLSDSHIRGKGFGLCLIKLLIDDYRGLFWVEDRVPGDHTMGARFVVVLPAATTEDTEGTKCVL